MSTEWLVFLSVALLVWIVVAVVVGSAIGLTIRLADRNTPSKPCCRVDPDPAGQEDPA